MHLGSHVGICTPLYPNFETHLQIFSILLNGFSSSINCAKNIAGPLIVFIVYTLVHSEVFDDSITASINFIPL